MDSGKLTIPFIANFAESVAMIKPSPLPCDRDRFTWSARQRVSSACTPAFATGQAQIAEVYQPEGEMMRHNMTKLAFLAAWAFQGFVSPASSAFAQSVSDLVGTWTLVSSVTEKDGKKTEQFGSNATGMMSLDTDGHFMLTIIGPDLPRFASNNRANGTAEENRAVMRKSIAMIGTYSINPTDKTLTFRVDSATFPNWNGTAQKRSIVTASRDELKYITATASSGGVGTVTWKRAK